MRRAITAAIGAGVLASLVTLAPANAKPGGDQTLHPDTGAGGTSYGIGTFWWDSNHGGPAIIWKGGAPCTGALTNYDYKEASLSQEDFLNATSSVRDYNSCDTALWDGANYSGARSGGSNGWFDAGSTGTYNLDVWNDRTNSAAWS